MDRRISAAYYHPKAFVGSSAKGVGDPPWTMQCGLGARAVGSFRPLEALQQN